MSRDILSPGHVSAGQAVGVLSSPGITQVSPGEAEGPRDITYYYVCCTRHYYMLT